MMVLVDRAGRVVIPKELRERLQFLPDTEVELTVEGDSIRLSAAHTMRRVIVETDGWPVLQAIEGHTITDSDVQRWRDADQR